MVNKMGKKSIIVTSVAICVILLGIGVAYLLGAFKTKEADPYRQNSSQQSTDQNNATNDSDSTPDTKNPDTSNSDTPASTVDPATVSSLPIESLGIEVSYVKGIGGFEYQILRTDAGTSYAEFRNADLIGTKCTGDEGAFASIIVSPSADEDTSTISQKVTLDNTVYGLSLMGANCTGDTALFSKYQDSFKNAFSLLKKIDKN